MESVKMHGMLDWEDGKGNQAVFCSMEKDVGRKTLAIFPSGTIKMRN
jgi:hypothetical protein